jgi:PAS domain S-box-containing protein
LRRQSQMLEAFFRHTITPLAFLDRHFNFVRVNEAYARAAGKSPEYFIGKNHFALYPHEENQAIFAQTVQSRRAYQAHARPFTYPDQPERGTTYWDWRLTPLCSEAGQVQFLVLSLDDVTERQKAVDELERRRRQLQALALELSEAEDRERRRLAEILHDDVQQILAAAKFRIGLLDGRVQGDKSSVEIVKEVKQMLKDAIEKSRSLSHELGPAMLSQSSLDDTFAWLAQQMETKHGLVVHLQTRGPTDSSSEPVRTFLYRAAREILFNVVKHAEVTEAKLRLRRVRNRLRLTISDKGQGFDLRSLGLTAGFGLLNVRERAEFLGGQMRIRSALGKGSTFSIAVPDAVTSAD